MLSVKPGIKSLSLFRKCLLKKKFASGQASTKRTLKNSLYVLASKISSSPFAEEKLWTFSLLPMPPVYLKFSSISIYSSVNIRSIFRVEPMHAFTLELTKILKECLFPFSSVQRELQMQCKIIRLNTSCFL